MSKKRTIEKLAKEDFINPSIIEHLEKHDILIYKQGVLLHNVANLEYAGEVGWLWRFVDVGGSDIYNDIHYMDSDYEFYIILGGK